MSYIPIGSGTRVQVILLTLAATGAWALSVGLSAALQVEGWPHQIGQVVHILAMVIAFGAIILVDWHGFLWLIGRRQLGETIRLDGAAGPLIWGGLLGMLATGVFLNPDLASPLTQIKLFSVLLLMLNGIFLIPLMRRLEHLPKTTRFADLPARKRNHMLVCLSVSQLCWWTAIIVGFINAKL